MGSLPVTETTHPGGQIPLLPTSLSRIRHRGKIQELPEGQLPMWPTSQSQILHRGKIQEQPGGQLQLWPIGPSQILHPGKMPVQTGHRGNQKQPEWAPQGTTKKIKTKQQKNHPKKQKILRTGKLPAEGRDHWQERILMKTGIRFFLTISHSPLLPFTTSFWFCFSFWELFSFTWLKENSWFTI